MEPVTAALSILGFVASGAVLVASAWDAPISRLALARGAGLALCGTLVAIGLLGELERWALGLACVGLLLSLQAIALTFGRLAPLCSYLTDRRPGEDPPWWPAFERRFWRYVSHRPRAQNPLRDAVTRQRPCKEASSDNTERVAGERS
jgi:hypothetical protein